MSHGMAEELWPLEEAVKKFLEGRKGWREQDHGGLFFIAVPVSEIEDLEIAYDEVREALDAIEKEEDQ